MRLEVDRETCVGHGRCYTIAPDVFEPDEEGHAEVIGALTDANRENAISAAKSCPERAIRIVE